jgi:DNA-binding transcriptional ArsR family regulator
MFEDELSANGDTWILNTLTGELTQDAEETNKNPRPYLDPIDIPSITSLEEYTKVIKEKTYRRRYKLWICPLLLDIITEKHISIPALSLLCLLGRKVGYNNMVYTSTKELAEGCGYSRQTISSSLSELKGCGLIKEPNPKLVGKDDRFILVSPLYFFLGYYPYRDVLLRDWMLSS